MKQTAVEWLYEISKEREIDKFDLEKAKEMEKWQRMKFEIPELYDEEIEDEAKEYRKRLMQHYSKDETFGDMVSFEMGAKWYREQLKQRQ